jgi:hypothetical protein
MDDEESSLKWEVAEARRERARLFDLDQVVAAVEAMLPTTA